MGKLREDPAAGIMHGICHRPPGNGLFFGEQARHVDGTDRLPTDPGGLGHDQAGRSALAIIVDVKLGRDQRGVLGSPTGHGGHHHAVLQQHLGKAIGGQEGALERSLICHLFIPLR